MDKGLDITITICGALLLLLISSKAVPAYIHSPIMSIKYDMVPHAHYYQEMANESITEN